VLVSAGKNFTTEDAKRHEGARRRTEWRFAHFEHGMVMRGKVCLIVVIFGIGFNRVESYQTSLKPTLPPRRVMPIPTTDPRRACFANYDVKDLY
jgi:hypothetical protein